MKRIGVDTSGREIFENGGRYYRQNARRDGSITFDAWEREYRPVLDGHSWKDYLRSDPEVKKAHQEGRLWSLMDDDGDKVFVQHGFHWANVLGYHITEKPCTIPGLMVYGIDRKPKTNPRKNQSNPEESTACPQCGAPWPSNLEVSFDDEGEGAFMDAAWCAKCGYDYLAEHMARALKSNDAGTWLERT